MIRDGDGTNPLVWGKSVGESVRSVASRDSASAGYLGNTLLREDLRPASIYCRRILDRPARAECMVPNPGPAQGSNLPVRFIWAFSANSGDARQRKGGCSNSILLPLTHSMSSSGSLGFWA